MFVGKIVKPLSIAHLDPVLTVRVGDSDRVRLQAVCTGGVFVSRSVDLEDLEKVGGELILEVFDRAAEAGSLVVMVKAVLGDDEDVARAFPFA